MHYHSSQDMPISSSSSSFPPEIWGEIVSLLTVDDFPTYLSLSLVSKSMRATVDRFMYRELPFLPPPTSNQVVGILLHPGAVHGVPGHLIPRSILLLRTLMRRPQLLRQVQSFCIQRFAYLGDPFDYPAAAQSTNQLTGSLDRADIYNTCLSTVLEGMVNLRKLTISTEDLDFYLDRFSSYLQNHINGINIKDLAAAKPDVLYFFRQTLDMQWSPHTTALYRQPLMRQTWRKARGFQIPLPISEDQVNMLNSFSDSLEENGVGEGLAEQFGKVLGRIPRIAPLRILHVKDAFTPETYLYQLQEQTGGLTSLSVHGNCGNVLRPVIVDLDDMAVDGSGGIIADAYSPDIWSQLQSFEGCIEDLARILPGREHLTSITIVESGRLNNIGDIERFLLEGSENGSEGLLEEVCEGLNRITYLSIMAAEPTSGAFHFANIDSVPGTPTDFLSELHSLTTLYLPPLLVRDPICLSNLCHLSNLTHLFIGDPTFISPLPQTGTSCPCQWQHYDISRPTWSLIYTAQEEQAMADDVTMLFKAHPTLQFVLLYAYINIGIEGTGVPLYVYPRCDTCGYWRKAQYVWSRETIELYPHGVTQSNPLF